jgi:tRNA-specific 2-thiouridylase
VVEKNIQTNELIVGHEDDPRLWSSTVIVTDRQRSGNEYTLPLEASAKLRYRQPDQPCSITKNAVGDILLHFSSIQRAVTPGQIAVVYQDDILLAQ